MARKLRLYRVEGASAFIASPIREALGLPPHVQQAETYAVAESKASAARLIAETRYVSGPLGALRIAEGNDARAFIAAGQVTESAVYVHHHGGPRSASDGRALLRVALDGSTTLVGHFENPRQDGHVQYGIVDFVPAGGAS